MQRQCMCSVIPCHTFGFHAQRAETSSFVGLILGRNRLLLQHETYCVEDVEYNTAQISFCYHFPLCVIVQSRSYVSQICFKKDLFGPLMQPKTRPTVYRNSPAVRKWSLVDECHRISSEIIWKNLYTFVQIPTITAQICVKLDTQC